MIIVRDMEPTSEFRTWQDLLGQLIKNPQEKQRLAREAHVKTITLRRWVMGESQPREDNLHRLARALPSELAPAFQRLVEKEFPSFAYGDFEPGRVLPEIPSELYAQVLKLYAKTPPALARQNLYNLIFDRAIGHLDPDGLGMSITLACCVPPRDGRLVRSLRQTDGIGTPPFDRDQGRKTIFLGSESVAGTAVTTYRCSSIESREEVSFTPVHWTEYENSAIAFPILRQARVAGALIASSTRARYFTSVHRSLLELYANLVVLMFSPDEFYDPNDIKLGVMPALTIQNPYFAEFEHRMSTKLKNASRDSGHMTMQHAHRCVWQDIADELLHIRRGD